MSEQETVKMKCVVYWASTNKVNDMSGKYQINLGQLSDEAVAALEALGLDVADGSGALKANGDADEVKQEMARYITCKSNLPIRVFDADGIVIPEDVMIGNGSKAKAIVGTYDWKYKNKKGTSPSLKRLVVTDLVEYAEGGVSIDDEDVL